MADTFKFPFEKLEVWQLAVQLADFILKLMESFPTNRHYRLVGQIEAAACSISQNIAEGKGRQYKKEFIQFLYIAEGSLFEVLTLAEILKRRKMIADNDFIRIRLDSENIDRKLHGLINSLRSRS